MNVKIIHVVNGKNGKEVVIIVILVEIANCFFALKGIVTHIILCRDVRCNQTCDIAACCACAGR